MQLHQRMRLMYRKDRYMEFLNREDLEERCRNVFENMMLLSTQGQISLHSMDGMGACWMTLWTHILEEFQLRYGPYPNGFTNGFIKNADVVKPSFPDEPKAKTAIDKVGGIEKGVLYKFGKMKYLGDMFNHGLFRIAPASYYDDPSLNKAIRDDELSLSVEMRHDRVNLQSSSGEKISAFGNVQFTIQSKTNYYVHCFASDYTFREYDDFDADCCIVIKEPRKLIRKLLSTAAKAKKNLKGFATPVKYIDPLNCLPGDIEILFSKHFKYSYQNEFRIIWLPKEPTQKLDEFYVEVSSLDSYAELIRI